MAKITAKATVWNNFCDMFNLNLLALRPADDSAGNFQKLNFNLSKSNG